MVVFPTPPFWFAQAIVWPTQVPVRRSFTDSILPSGPPPPRPPRRILEVCAIVATRRLRARLSIGGVVGGRLLVPCGNVSREIGVGSSRSDTHASRLATTGGLHRACAHAGWLSAIGRSRHCRPRALVGYLPARRGQAVRSSPRGSLSSRGDLSLRRGPIAAHEPPPRRDRSDRRRAPRSHARPVSHGWQCDSTSRPRRRRHLDHRGRDRPRARLGLRRRAGPRRRSSDGRSAPPRSPSSSPSAARPLLAQPLARDSELLAPIVAVPIFSLVYSMLILTLVIDGPGRRHVGDPIGLFMPRASSTTRSLGLFLGPLIVIAP